MTGPNPQRRGLGRGLGSLIPSAPPAAPVHDDERSQHSESADGPLARADVPPSGLQSPVVGRTSAAAGTSSRIGVPPLQPDMAAAPDWIGRPSVDLPQGSRTTAESSGTSASEPSGAGNGAEASDAGSQPGRPDIEGLVPVAGAYFAEIPVSAIRPNPKQPRRVFDEDDMAELVQSISEVGLLQPVVVRSVGAGAYELVMGERRWRATSLAGHETIPAIVRDTTDDDLLRDALLENLHRAQLNPLEEAAAYQQLLDDFGCTHEELASRIGRSRPQISNTLRLLKLSAPVQRRVAAGVLSAGHARTLLAVDPQAQDRLAARVVAEGISVRGLEELVAVGELGTEDRPRPRASRPSSPAVADLAGRLSDLYDTRVRVDLGKSKGRITIEFASLSDLERIITSMDPTYTRRSGEQERTDPTAHSG